MSVSVHFKEKSGLPSSDKLGWLSIEGVDVPYLIREGSHDKYIPVRIVEREILFYYPNAYPKQLEKRPPLVCYYMKPEEVSDMNERCRKRGAGTQFTDTDTVVKLGDFLDFFSIVKQAYPDIVVGSRAPVVLDSLEYGWVLMRDAIVPYVVRQGARLAPVNVIRGAAQLLLDVTVSSTPASDPEITTLNTMCQNVGLVFTFRQNTALIDLASVREMCPDCTTYDLPKDNPMAFIDLLQPSDASHVPTTTAAVYTAKTGSPHQTSQATDQHIEQEGRLPAQSDGSARQSARCDPDQGSLTDPDAGSEGSVTTHANDQRAVTPQQKELDKHSAGVTPEDLCTAKNTPIPTSAPTKRDDGTLLNSTQPDTKATKRTQPIQIEPMECFGKTVSCLLRGRAGVAYALVEAVCRVYFPSCSLVDFIHFLQLELAVTLHTLKRAEEEAFIKFYGIPTRQLRCNQLIKLQDLKDRMEWLQRRFGHSERNEGQQQRQQPKGHQAASKIESPPNGRKDSCSESPIDLRCLSKITERVNNSKAGENVDYTENDVCAAGPRKDIKENVLDNCEQNGKNKNLESTIMRILQDKKEASIRTVDSQEEIDRSTTIVDGSHLSDVNKQTAAEDQVAPQTRKRKGAPPRKYLVHDHKNSSNSFDSAKREKCADD